MREELDGQINLFDMESGRMSPGPCPPEPRKAKTSGSSSKSSPKSKSRMPLFLDLRNGKTQDASWETDGVSLGGLWMPSSGAPRRDADGLLCYATSTDTQRPTSCLTLNCGEKPRVENPTKLSQILERNPDPKYNLSPKACRGILNRAEKRGKELPAELKAALVAQSQQATEPSGMEMPELTTEETSSLEMQSVSKSGGGKPGGGKGILIQHEHVGALSTLDNQRVLDMGEQTAYGISAFDSNAMKSDNPHSGIYKADTSRTLDLNGGSPACNQGGVAIVCPIEGNGSRASHFGNGYGEPGDPSFTLNTIERHGVAAYGIDQQGGKGGANYTEDIAPTLAADSHGTPHGVAYGIDHVITTGGNCTAQGPCVYEEIEATLKAAGPHSVAYGFTNRGYESGDVGETLRAGSHGAIPMVSFTQNQRDEVRDLNDVSGSIAAEPGTHQQTYVMFQKAVDVYNQTVDGDVAASLTAACGGTNTSGPKVIAGFKAGQSKDGGLGYAEEQAPTLSATPSALEPTLLSYGDE